MAAPAVEVRSLVKSFGDPPLEILKSINLVVEPGEFLAVTGRSGSGKSTLLYMMSGLDIPTSGSVLIDGIEIRSLPDYEFDIFRNQRLGFVFQFHYLLPELTALENVLMPARKTGQHISRHKKALDLLERFSASHCKDKVPGQMSGGEQQRVAIARSLIMDPDFLFADEPTGNLDSVNGEEVMKIFDETNRAGTTILMVTHEPDYAVRAGRVLHMKDGAIDSDVPGGRRAAVRATRNGAERTRK